MQKFTEAKKILINSTKGYDEQKNIEKRIEIYWDKRSEDFSKLRQKELLSENMPLWRELILSRLPKNKPLKILDAGTGAGFFAVILSNAGHEVVGIDMSEKMLEEARENVSVFGSKTGFSFTGARDYNAINSKVSLIKMAADKLKFPNETFDAVVSRNLTWTLPDATEAYREWHRVLKKGGRLLNFDSDRGKVLFTKKNNPNDVHANIEEDLIDECNKIKSSLKISAHTRPEWDIKYLKSIGFKVTFDADISSIVNRDKNLRYDDTPLFAIYGEK